MPLTVEAPGDFLHHINSGACWVPTAVPSRGMEDPLGCSVVCITHGL